MLIFQESRIMCSFPIDVVHLANICTVRISAPSACGEKHWYHRHVKLNLVNSFSVIEPQKITSHLQHCDLSLGGVKLHVCLVELYFYLYVVYVSSVVCLQDWPQMSAVMNLHSSTYSILKKYNSFVLYYYDLLLTYNYINIIWGHWN